MSIKLVIASVAALLSTPMTSRAATLLFTLDDTATSQVFTFEMDSNPKPNHFFQDTFEVSVFDATLNGAPDADLGPMSFQDSVRTGGMSSADAAIVTAGDQVFDGTTSNPYFSVGTFSLFNVNQGFAPETLTVTELSAAPEPSTWALMIAGFGVMGLPLRRRSLQIESGR